MIIRPATLDDLPAAAGILTSYNMSPDRFPPMARVIEEDGRVIACGGHFEIIPGIGWLASVAVAKDRRRTGLGTVLVNDILSHSKVSEMWLETYFWNSRFYERLGFAGVVPKEVPESIKGWRGNKHCRFMARANAS